MAYAEVYIQSLGFCRLKEIIAIEKILQHFAAYNFVVVLGIRKNQFNATPCQCYRWLSPQADGSCCGDGGSVIYHSKLPVEDTLSVIVATHNDGVAFLHLQVPVAVFPFSYLKVQV